MRTGTQYVESLRDDRAVYVYGERVTDVTTHPAFKGVIETVAKMYDSASHPDNEMVYTAPETGRTANRALMLPRTRKELASRHRAIDQWAAVSHGYLGRSPDHVAAFLAGFSSAPEVFDRGSHKFGENVQRFYRKLLEEDLYVTYVIVPPQVSRATTAHGWEGEFIQVGVVDEVDEGIIVRGAQMLGTASTISDYVFVSCIKPLQPEDIDHAISFVVPIGAPGVKLYCRRPYALGPPSSFDYPLSTRFDESDALVVFDDVLIPWEHVFLLRDVEGVRDQFFETAAHNLGNNQAQIRMVRKLRFLIGLARKIAATNQIDRVPSVREKLGDLASWAAIVEGMLIASEVTADTDQFGVCRPNPRFLYAVVGLQAELYPKVVHLVRELAGGGVIQLPSSAADFAAEDARTDLERYVQSPGVPSEERVKLFKLAWDAVGSEFAGRHYQYEMFYAGAPFIAKGWSFQYYGFEEAVEEVEEFLASYKLSEDRDHA